MTVVAALTQLGTVAQAATVALGVRANLIFSQPPEQLAALPAVVHHWSSSTFDQYPFGQVPTGFQFEQATITVMYLTNLPTMSRAHPAVLAFVDAYRALIAVNQDLANTVRQVRLTRASIGMVEYNGNEFMGADLTLECDLYHATTWVEA
tara:strand:- start:9441 stop:9890 length:450 start_codon:yes stop_codon:yes gene_type:complete